MRVAIVLAFASSRAASSNLWMITICSCDYLTTPLTLGLSDPYVKLKYGDLRKKTEIIMRSLEPKWNQAFEFPVFSNDVREIIFSCNGMSIILTACTTRACTHIEIIMRSMNFEFPVFSNDVREIIISCNGKSILTACAHMHMHTRIRTCRNYRHLHMQLITPVCAHAYRTSTQAHTQAHNHTNAHCSSKLLIPISFFL